MECPDCGSKNVRIYSQFNKESDRWDWMNGCNECDWQSRNEDEEKLHPEYYSRMPESPAMINSKDIVV